MRRNLGLKSSYHNFTYHNFKGDAELEDRDLSLYLLSVKKVSLSHELGKSVIFRLFFVNESCQMCVYYSELDKIWSLVSKELRSFGWRAYGNRYVFCSFQTHTCWLVARIKISNSYLKPSESGFLIPKKGGGYEMEDIIINFNSDFFSLFQ